MTNPLTEEQILCIQHFHDKGDVTRWLYWETTIPQISEHHPELLKAVSDFKTASVILDLVVKHLGD